MKCIVQPFSRKGFTLLEAILAVALVAVLVTLLISTLLPALGLSRRGSERVELQQSAVLVLERMTQDLEITTPDGVTWGTEVVVLHPLNSVTATGRQVWDQRLIYYRLEARDLNRYEWRPTGGLTFPHMADRPQRLDAGQVARLVGEPTSASLRLATGVGGFALTPEFELQMELERRPDARDGARMSISRKFFLKNS